MAINGVNGRNGAATGYKNVCAYATLTQTAATLNTPGTEITGITRLAANWGTPAASAVTASPAAFSVASGKTVAGVDFYDLASAGTWQDGTSVTSQAFSSAGTYTVTVTFTET